MSGFPGGGKGIGTISDITSTDFTITAPTGPTTNIDGPLLANLAAGGFKITGLANGSAASDAAAFGQIPLVPGGTLLADMQYAPASIDTINLSTTLAALDATNLTLALTVPASGKVTIKCEFYFSVTDTTGANAIGIGLLNHAGGAQLGKTIMMAQPTANALTYLIRSTATFLLTGLTPGALQVDFAAGCSNTSTGAAGVFAQGVTGNPTNSTSGPLVMEAFAG